MRYDDRKLSAKVREETLREVKAWVDERRHAVVAAKDPGAFSLLVAVSGYLAALADECHPKRPTAGERLIAAAKEAQAIASDPAHPKRPTEDDGFVTVHVTDWPGIDGGLDG